MNSNRKLDISDIIIGIGQGQAFQCKLGALGEISGLSEGV